MYGSLDEVELGPVLGGQITEQTADLSSELCNQNRVLLCGI